MRRGDARAQFWLRPGCGQPPYYSVPRVVLEEGIGSTPRRPPTVGAPATGLQRGCGSNPRSCTRTHQCTRFATLILEQNVGERRREGRLYLASPMLAGKCWREADYCRCCTD